MTRTIDYEELRTKSNRRLAAADMQLLERACTACQAKAILEIGSADGGSSVILATQAAERRGRLWCVEPAPKGRMMENMRAYGLEGAYTLLPAASPWLAPEQLQQIPPQLDLLFIDGRHDLRWCLVDYHYWEPRVRPGGVIIFHDTAGRCREDRAQADFGHPGYIPLVRRAINIILTTDPLIEIDASDAADGGAVAYCKGIVP